MCDKKTNDAEYLVEVKDGKRYFNNKILVPSIMLWRCVGDSCTTPPKPQRRSQYKDKSYCVFCFNKIKLTDPEVIKRRGQAISQAISKAGDKWALVAKKNMSSQESRNKISSSMKAFLKDNKEALDIRKHTALANNEKSGFGTAEFGKKQWEKVSIEDRVKRIEKSRIKNVVNGKLEHLTLMSKRHPGFVLIEYGEKTHVYECPNKHSFVMMGNNFLKRGTCPVCTPKSHVEIDMLDWANSIKDGWLLNKRVLYIDDSHNGNRALEIDLYNDDLKLGIEFHGLFYHKTTENETVYSVDKNYHQYKQELALLNNIKLLQFFEDETDNKMDIVKSIIKSKMNKNDQVFYARNCDIKTVHSKEKDQFLKHNHLQGHCRSFLNMGLYHEDKLVSILTIRKVKKQENKCEIARYCNLINTTVVGGFNRLLKYIENVLKKNGFEELITYSDKRYSDGFVYKTNGFVKAHETEPDMFWCEGVERFPRQISWGKTDKEMYDGKYYKIYGAGHILWKKQL